MNGDQPAGSLDIGHTFQDPALLELALTHASALDGKKSAGPSNERLEFLGDRVLGLIMARRLYAAFPEEGESGLAPRFNALVNRQACAVAARRMGLGPALRLSRAEAQGGGRDKDTILADACEAVIAAVYLDAGLEAAEAVVTRAWGKAFDHIAIRPREPKAALQEWAAARKKANPRYSLVRQDGPDHAPRFTVRVEVAELAAAEADGGSKREAEQAAATRLLTEIGDDRP
jgi:ribonuclease-3